jgi:outer membrane protein assembly factor BamB
MKDKQVLKRILTLLAIAAATCAESRANWPTVRHNAQRNATTSQSLDARSLAPAWKYTGAGLPQPAWHGPAKWDAYSLVSDLHSMRNYDVAYDAVVVDGKCYFATSAEHAVVCLDAGSGEESWRFFAGGSVRIAPTYSDGKLYFGADDGFAYCIDGSGNLVWKFSPTAALSREKRRLIVNNGNLIPLWPVRTGVVVEAGTAYFAASLLPWDASYLCAVDANTGQPTGTGHYVRELEGMTFEGPLALSSDLLIAPQGRVPPALFARRNGQPLGSLKEGGGGAYVVVVEGEVLHGPGNKSGWVTRSDVRTGDRVATHPQARAVVVDRDVTYLLTKRMLVALERGKTQPKWMTKVSEPLSMIAAANVLIVGKLDGVEAYDIESGSPVWSGEVNGRAHGLAISDDTLFVSTDTGEIAAFRASGQQIAAAQTPDTSPTEAQWIPAPPPAIDDEALMGRWVFQRPYASWLHVQNLVNQSFASSAAPVDLVRIGELEAANIAPSGLSFTVAETLRRADVPRRDLTVEAWVRVDEAQPWGGIVSAIQDDGDEEHGWLLGYRDDRFCFGLTGREGDAKLMYMSADQPFIAGRWYHVAGTYDGKTMQLFVDGELSASSAAERGDIDYPRKTPFELGAYRDSNENYPLVGALQEVRLYRRALGDDEIGASHSAKKGLFPPPLDLTPPTPMPTMEVAVGPWLQFTGPGQAVIRWQTAEPTPTHLELQLEGERQVYSGDPREKTTEHEIHIDNLLHNRVYTYRILSDAAGKGLASEAFECDTFFDYNQPDEFYDVVNEAAARSAAAIVDEARSQAGICLLYSCNDVEVAIELARRSKYRVHWFVVADAEVESARRKLLERGAAARVYVHSLETLGNAWLTPHLASAIVVGDSAHSARPSDEEISRLLSPNGIAWLNVSTSDQRDKWHRVAGEPLSGSGSWTHAYGRSDNAAFGGEKLAGASATGELQVQWLGRPGPRYQADRGNRNPPPLAANGRLFTQGLDRMIAIDQYNGGVLWALEIPKMRRYNVPRDCANWCADDDYVYAAVRDKVWKIDAATGEVVHFDVPAKNLNGRGFDWGYVASEGKLLIGSAVGSGSSYTEFWGAAMWYDATSGPHAAKVVSDKLFAVAKADGYELWQYQNGLIQNATITIGNGKIVFVESRSAELKQAAARRIDSAELFRELFLVALDVRTGKRLWEKALESVDGTTMLCMAATDDHLVLVASHPKQFDLSAFDMNSGGKLWNTTAPWPDGREDHGVHLSRPSMIGDRLFLRPYVFDLATGELHPKRIPIGGCGTHACAADALIFRSGSGGMVSMWSPETGQYSHFPRLRPNCWLNVVPAGGCYSLPKRAADAVAATGWKPRWHSFRRRCSNRPSCIAGKTVYLHTTSNRRGRFPRLRSAL